MDFWCVLYSFTINFFFALAIGMFLLVCTKRNYVITVVAVVTILVNLVLAGYVVGVNTNHYTPFDYSYHSPLYYLVYIDPFWYCSTLSFESFFHLGPNGFNILQGSIFEPNIPLVSAPTTLGGYNYVLTTTDKWLNLLLPLVFTFGFGIPAIYCFKWNVRS